MPKSRRVQEAVLSQVKAKGREHKDALIDRIREAVEEYPHVYTFQVKNLRTNLLQQVREDRREDSRFFLGNNKVMGVALGKDADSAIAPNLHKLGPFLTGLSGLLFTKMPKKELKAYLAGVGGSVFARAGATATASLRLPQGPLPQFPHSMYEHLTKLGLPLTLDKGVLVLAAETVVCEEGDVLSAEAAQLLQLFGMETAEFGIDLTAHWTGGVARTVSAGAKE
jgi:mRNA turnover protein 4